MGKIYRLKILGIPIYVATIPQAVIDPSSGKSARAELDEKANHGYETEPKTLKQVDENLLQLAGEVSELELKDVVQSDKIKDIKNVISTMNPNQSAQLSVSGRKTVSLPKNASNGGMSVKLDGLTAENLVANGDFRNGTTGWTNYAGGASVVESGYVKYTPISIVGAISNGFKQLSVGNKWYVRTIIKSSSPVTGSIGFAKSEVGTILVVGNIGTSDTTISGILTISNANINEFIIGRPTVIQSIYIKNASAINLTQIFGSGNEPDLATCDAMFSSYFEGKKNFIPTGRMRSVGKNLFNKRLLNKLVPSENINYARTPFIEVPAGSKAILSIKPKTVVPEIGQTLYIINEDGTFSSTYIVYNTVDSRFITHIAKSDKIAIGVTYYNTIRPDLMGRLIEADIQLEINSSTAPTTYKPYRSTSLYLSAPELRSNGLVKDEIRKGANGYELVKRISEVDGTVLTTPVISPISYGGILNSAENGTVYHEPVIADAGVYGTNMPILLTDYPIASIDEIIKHENGVDTYLDVSTAVIAGDKLSFTHPSLQSGDLVLFTYAFSKETTNGNITATYYDSNVVKIDTVTGKAYKITDAVTNGVLTRTLTEV